MKQNINHSYNHQIKQEFKPVIYSVYQIFFIKSLMFIEKLYISKNRAAIKVNTFDEISCQILVFFFLSSADVIKLSNWWVFSPFVPYLK